MCYGVANAKTVSIDPPVEGVWPSVARCLNVSPRRTTVYTLTASDGAGLAWLHRNADVLEKIANADGSTAVTVRADRAKAEVARKRFD